MTGFTSRLLGLAGAAMIFSGISFGSVGCVSNGVVSSLIRGEGTTELVATLTATCSTVAGGEAATTAVLNPTTLTVILSPNVTITSKLLGSAAVPATANFTEALATTACVSGGCGAGTGSVQGVVVGPGQISVTGLPTPAMGAGAGVYSITIQNVRVNASQIATAAATVINAQPYIVGAIGAAPDVSTNLMATQQVATVQNGLAGVSVTGITNPLICASIAAQAGSPAAPTPAFSVKFGENFSNSFKTLAGEASTFGPGGFPNITGPGNAVASGTLITISIAGIPTGVTAIYSQAVVTPNLPAKSIPLVAGAYPQPAGVGSITAVLGPTNPAAAVPVPATGSFSSFIGTEVGTAAGGNTTATGGNVVSNYPVVQVPITGTTASQTYVVTAAFSVTEAYTVPVYVVAAAGAVPGVAQMTANVSFATTGTIPSWVSGSSTPSPAPNASAWSLCNTTLLFPFVINGGGFDSGIAISNTSYDLLAAGPKSSATAQGGTCLLTFFGSGGSGTAISSTNPSTAYTAPATATVNPGSTYLAMLSTINAGFNGYMIAQCNFLYGHGFAYLTYNSGASTGMAMGYLANAINPARGGVGITGEVTN